MPNPAQQANVRGVIDDDLQRLEVGIRKLKVQYDMFFAGALKCEPVELRKDLDRIIRRHTKKPPGKYAERFRFNGLVSRYNSFSELWGKTVRAREEGNQRQETIAEKFGIREQLVTRCTVSDPAAQQAELRRLHARYVETSRRHGSEGKTMLSFEKFARGVSVQTTNLRERVGCDQIELRLVVRDDKVQLKARPGR